MTIKLFHKDSTGCSVEGVPYERGAGGAFEVQDEHVAALLAHGFTTVPPEAPAAAPATGNPAQWTKEVLEAEANRLGVSINQTRAEILKAVASKRKEEADAAEAQAAAEAKAARMAELEAKDPETLTEAEAAELIALQAGE